MSRNQTISEAPAAKARGPQVIAVGLPRTGTTTIGKALSILLDGPVLDAVGETFYRGTWADQDDLIVLNTLEPGDPVLLAALDKLLTAKKPYVATTDFPFPQFIEELRQLYPDLKFVCTTRDFDSWYASFVATQSAMADLVPWAFLWWRLKRFTQYVNGFWKARLQYNLPDAHIPVGTPFLQRPLTDKETARGLWDGHHAYVQRVVPEDRLLLFDAREGWEPLCKFLGKDLPHVDFPHEWSRNQVHDLRDKIIDTVRSWGCMALLGSSGVGVALAAWLHWSRAVETPAVVV